MRVSDGVGVFDLVGVGVRVFVGVLEEVGLGVFVLDGVGVGAFGVLVGDGSHVILFLSSAAYLNSVFAAGMLLLTPPPLLKSSLFKLLETLTNNAFGLSAGVSQYLINLPTPAPGRVVEAN
jgi:hypothetical protein